MPLSTDYIFFRKKCTKFVKKKHFIAIDCSLKYFKAIRKMAAQYLCILFYEFSLNFVEICTKFANYQRYIFVVRSILKLFARWHYHIRL